MNKQSQSKLNAVFNQLQVVRKAQNQARLELDKLEDLVREINQTMKEGDTSRQSERMPLSSFNEYEFKVYPIGKGREVYRHISISGDHTLDNLCEIIIESFDFIDEHLYEFCMDNRIYSRNSYQSDPESDMPSTRIQIDRLDLFQGQKFLLHYDFGDDWRFAITVLKITKSTHSVEPDILKSVGYLVQYPDYEDEWDEE